jgi:glycosyltransferase involved in cell wall biosynthesis
LNIAHVTSRYFPWYGGAELFVREIIRRTREHSHRVITTTARTVEETFVPNQIPYSSDIVEGVPVERHPCIRPRGFWEFARAVDAGLGLYLYGPNSVGQITSLLKSDYDLLHCCPFVGTHNLYGFLASQIRRKRIVFTPCIHTADKYHFDRKYLFEMLKRATRVNALTNHEKAFMTKHGVPAKNVFVTGIGIDPNEFKHVESLNVGKEGEFLISFVGRLDRQKGIYDLLNSATELQGVRVLVVGEVVEGFLQFYESMLSEKKGRIQLWLDTPEHKIPRRQALSVINSSDVFCLPSNIESFGAVYLEAMMLGKPVIARNTAVSREVIGEAGLFVEDQRSLRDAIKRLMTEPALREELGRIGRQNVQSRYTWEAIANRFRENISRL